MEVINARLVSADRRARVNGGVYIEFISEDNIVKDANVELTYKNGCHYFNVTDIEIEGKNLKVKAVEVGYYASKFDHKENFDLREIIGLPIMPVTDPKTISKIFEMSCWC